MSRKVLGGLVCSLAAFVAVPASLAMAQESEKGNWVVAHQDGDTTYAIQCGFDVTVFTLEYFGLKYAVQDVSLALPLSEDGASLLDIQRVLQAFGLESHLRKSVATRQIARAVAPDTLAVIPLAAGGSRNHYVVAAMDNQRRPVLVDVPRKSVSLHRVSVDAKLQGAGGVVMFVQRHPMEESLSERIRLTPNRVHLGEFFVAGPELVSRQSVSVTLSNESSLPVMVSGVRTSCGCTRPSWRSGLVLASESRELEFEIHSSTWGRGSQEKSVILTYPDGSQQVIGIEGVGIVPEQVHRIEIAKDAANVDLTGTAPRGHSEVRICEITVTGGQVSEVSVASNTAWMEPRLVPTVENSGDLWVKIDKALATPELNRHSNQIYGKVTLSTRKDAPPVEVSIHVFRKEFFRLEPAMVTLPRHGGEAAKVSVVPCDCEAQVEVNNVRSECGGLVLESGNTEGIGTLTIQVDDAEAALPGFHIVECDVESSFEMRSVAKLVVRISP